MRRGDGESEEKQPERYDEKQKGCKQEGVVTVEKSDRKEKTLKDH